MAEFPTEEMLRAFYEATHDPKDTPAGGFTRWATWEEAAPFERERILKGYRAMLAAAPPAVEGGALTVDDLAQEIRRMDGNHDLGAGALAEALMPFLSALATREEAPAIGDGPERALQDAVDFGIGFPVDGERVSPDRVTVVRGEEAPAEAGMKDGDASDQEMGRACRKWNIGTPERLAEVMLEFSALRAQPAPASSEVLKPFANIYDQAFSGLSDGIEVRLDASFPLQDSIGRARGIRYEHKSLALTVGDFHAAKTVLYTEPSPDADKLKVAVEALERLVKRTTRHVDDTDRDAARDLKKAKAIAADALAALTEGKG